MKTTIIARSNGRYIHLRGHWSRFSVARYCTRLGILSYRAAWLRVEVPEEARRFLYELPDTDIQPAWV